MSNVDGPVSFILFNEPPYADQDLDPAVDAPVGYLRSRERAERSLAKGATSLAGRRVHQELAQCYAKKLEKAYGRAGS